MSILEVSKTLMCKLWYDFIKPKFQDNAKLCYMDTDSFIINIKTDDFYEDIADDVKKGFDTSNYEIDGPLPTGYNKKVIGLIKDELGGKFKTEFAALRPKNYSYLMDGSMDEIILKSQQRVKSEAHNVYTKEVSKITLSNSNDKRLQTFEIITSYSY